MPSAMIGTAAAANNAYQRRRAGASLCARQNNGTTTVAVVAITMSVAIDQNCTAPNNVLLAKRLRDQSRFSDSKLLNLRPFSQFHGEPRTGASQVGELPITA